MMDFALADFRPSISFIPNPMTPQDEPIFSKKRIALLAETMAIPADELEALIGLGESHSYPAGAWLCHESSPRGRHHYRLRRNYRR